MTAIRESPFLNGVVWFFAGNAFYAMCQWGLLILLARIGTPAMVGEYVLGLAIAAPVFLLSNLQIRAIQSTDVEGEYSFGDYLALRLVTSAAALILVSGIALTAGLPGESVRVVLAIGSIKALEAVSDVFHGDLQRRERISFIALYLAAKGLLSVAAFGIAVRMFGSVSAGVFAIAAIFAVVLLLAEARFAVPAVGLRWNPPVLRRLMRTALPLGVAMMLISLNSNMPRYFVERWMGSESLGVFGALTYLSLAGSTAINATGMAAAPRLARLYASDQFSAFRTMVRRMSGAALVLGIGGIGILVGFGRPVLTLLYGPSYAAHLPVAILTMAAGGLSFVASVLGYGLTAARCFRPQLPLFAVVTLVAAMASLLLVPRYGLMGAAGSQIAAAAAQLIGSACLLWLVVPRPGPAGIPAQELVA